MRFKTLEEIQEHNKNAFESVFGKIAIQENKVVDINGLSYFERITIKSQPHSFLDTDWMRFSTSSFSSRLLPKTTLLKGKAIYFFDGAELFKNLKKTPQKLLPLFNDNNLINIIAYSYPKGVKAEIKKNKVVVANYEIATFIEISKDNLIDVSFKFGDNFKEFLNSNSVDKSKMASISTLENNTYKFNKSKFQNYFNNKLVHYDMMRFVIDTIEIKKKEKSIEEIEDDFIPIITLNTEQEEIDFKISNNLKEKVELSEFLDKDKREIKLKGIKLEKDAVIEFIVKQGNSKAKDNEGNITIKAKGVEIISKNKKVKKLDGKKYDYSIDINDVQYGWKIKVKLSERTIEKGAYIDFYANDDDYIYYSVSNVHCGRFLVSSGKKCTCKKSIPAKSFKNLVELVKQAEEALIENGWDDVNDRISIIRGVYYGTEWSLDYQNEKNTTRNNFFNIYTGSTVVADARKELKCSSKCDAKIFDSLYSSFEIFDSQYVAVDFGHLIIGLDSRRSWTSKNITLNGGTGLENNTWVGDLGGGTAKLALDRIEKPNKRAITMFPVKGSSYGAMVNLEGDIAAYVVGMDINKESKIDDPTGNFDTIHDSLKDYFENKWDKRAFYFLKMIDGEFEDDILKNKEELVDYCAEAFESFAFSYAFLRYTKEELIASSGYFKPASKEIASIFIDGLLHVIENPKDMITKRTDPDPLPKEDTTLEQINDMINELKK